MELRKQFTSIYWFIIKDTTQQQPDGRDAEGEVWGGTEPPCCLWAPPSQHFIFTSATSLEALRGPQFGDFYGGFPAQARLVIDSISSFSSPLSGGQGRGADSAKPPIVAGFSCDAHPAAN